MNFFKFTESSPVSIAVSLYPITLSSPKTLSQLFLSPSLPLPTVHASFSGQMTFTLLATIYLKPPSSLDLSHCKFLSSNISV